MKKINELIKKYDSNWFYCDCKSKYGNDVLFLLKGVVKDLNELKKIEKMKKEMKKEKITRTVLKSPIKRGTLKGKRYRPDYGVIYYIPKKLIGKKVIIHEK